MGCPIKARSPLATSESALQNIPSAAQMNLEKGCPIGRPIPKKRCMAEPKKQKKVIYFDYFPESLEAILAMRKHIASLALNIKAPQ